MTNVDWDRHRKNVTWFGLSPKAASHVLAAAFVSSAVFVLEVGSLKRNLMDTWEDSTRALTAQYIEGGCAGSLDRWIDFSAKSVHKIFRTGGQMHFTATREEGDAFRIISSINNGNDVLRSTAGYFDSDRRCYMGESQKNYFWPATKEAFTTVPGSLLYDVDRLIRPNAYSTGSLYPSTPGLSYQRAPYPGGPQ